MRNPRGAAATGAYGMSSSLYNFFTRRRVPVRGVVRLETPEAKGLAEFTAQRTAASEFNPVGPLWTPRPTRAGATHISNHIGAQAS